MITKKQRIYILERLPKCVEWAEALEIDKKTKKILWAGRVQRYGITNNRVWVDMSGCHLWQTIKPGDSIGRFTCPAKSLPVVQSYDPILGLYRVSGPDGDKVSTEKDPNIRMV